jgi:anti-sigma factor RsiW
MTCDFSRENLSDLIDGELGAESELAIKAHLQACAECSALHTRLKSVGEHLRNWHVPAASDDFNRGLMTRRRTQRRSHGIWLKLTLPVAAVVTFTLVLWWLSDSASPEYQRIAAVPGVTRDSNPKPNVLHLSNSVWAVPKKSNVTESRARVSTIKLNDTVWSVNQFVKGEH